jgi:hypothetical protein
MLLIRSCSWLYVARTASSLQQQQQKNPEAHAKGTLNLRVLFRYVNSFGPGYAIPSLIVLYTVTQVRGLVLWSYLVLRDTLYTGISISI